MSCAVKLSEMPAARRQRSPAAQGRRAVWEETPNAGTGRRGGPLSICTADGRLWRVAEFQSSKRRIFREWPRNDNGKRHRAKVSSALMKEAATVFSVDVGNLTPRESVSQHGCGLGSKRALVRPFPCLLYERFFWRDHRDVSRHRRRGSREEQPGENQAESVPSLCLRSIAGLILLQAGIAAGAFLGQIHLGDGDQDFGAGFQIGRL
jgi:hypothetical protein